MDQSNEYNQRQYRLMRQRLASLDSGQLDIGTLISDVEALLGYLENEDPAWRSAFSAELETLEEWHAVSLDRVQSIHTLGGNQRIANAIEMLKKLLVDKVRADDNEGL